MDRMNAQPPSGRSAGDPLIDEVRERRRRLLEEHDNDLERFCRALQAFQAEHPDKVRPRGSSAQGR